MNYSTNNPARVLIVDDHAIVRYGMGVLLSGADDLSLCGEAGTVDEALEKIRELRPDVAVIDIILHDRSGLDLIREIRSQETGVRGQEAGVRGQETGVRGQEAGVRDQTSGVRSQEAGVRGQTSGVRSQRSEIRDQDTEDRGQRTEDRNQPPSPKAAAGHRKAEAGGTPAVQTPPLPHSHTPPLPHSQTPPLPLPILVMSMHDEATHAEKALRAGAQGYIMKEDADEVLVEALRTVLDGKLYVSDGIHEKMLRTYVEGDNSGENGGIESLTAREKEVFAGVGKGLTSKEIAEQFNLSPRTVEVHRANIKKKLQCDSAARMLRMAVQWVEKNA